MCLMSLAEAKYMLETLDGISRVFRPFCIVCALCKSRKYFRVGQEIIEKNIFLKFLKKFNETQKITNKGE